MGKIGNHHHFSTFGGKGKRWERAEAVGGNGGGFEIEAGQLSSVVSDLSGFSIDDNI